MSKLLLPDDQDVPPPYAESSSNPLTPSSSLLPTSLLPTSLLPRFITSPFTDPLTAHLNSLALRMQATHQARITAQATSDLTLITLLVPHIEAFLSDLGATLPSQNPHQNGPSSAELTLVPGSAVPRGWALSGVAERRKEGEVVRVIRVVKENYIEGKTGHYVVGDSDVKLPRKTNNNHSYNYNYNYEADDDNGDNDGRTVSSRQTGGFDDEWGRFDVDDDFLTGSGTASAPPAEWWYFRDEGMARRLATYLQPPPASAPVVVERKAVQAKVASASSSSSSSAFGWRWGKEKKTNEPVKTTAAGLQQQKAVASSATETDDRASMTVRAQEVTFRKENSFGVWESLTGFGIVVTVRVSRV